MDTLYFAMTDRFMSGWGHAKNKTNKLVIVCNGWEEAKVVRDNALDRSEMKYVNICTTNPIPRYQRNGYLVSVHGRGQADDGGDDYSTWFEPNAFADTDA